MSRAVPSLPTDGVDRPRVSPPEKVVKSCKGKSTQHPLSGLHGTHYLSDVQHGLAIQDSFDVFWLVRRSYSYFAHDADVLAIPLNLVHTEGESVE